MLTRVEKENKAIELLKKDYSFRFIAKKCHLSLTVISNLKKKLFGVEKSLVMQGDNISDSKCTEAYALFDKQKMKLIDVAIKLRLDEKTTSKFWREYCRLKNDDDLIRIYNELGPDLGSFLELYKLMNEHELSPMDVDYVAQKILDVQELEQHETKLNDRVSEMESQKVRLGLELDAKRQQWGLLEKYCDELKDEIDLLELQIHRLKELDGGS